MARRKKQEEEGGGNPAWLITFSDLMTLLLTFFVLLVSMSTVDEMRRLEVLTTVTGAFGFGTAYSNPIARTRSNQNVEPGPMEMDQTADMEAIKDMLWEDLGKDINFLSNRYVQILSINNDVLFKKGSSTLTPEGMRLLDRMLPVLLRLEYPLLIGGHTSTTRDEEGEDFLLQDLEKKLSPSWMLSFMRCAGVYDYLKSKGMPASMLSLEAFGQYRPRYPDKTARDRRANRRVDLVLDKRNPKADANLLDRLRNRRRPTNDSYKYRDFIFQLPGSAPERKEEPRAPSALPEAPERP